MVIHNLLHFGVLILIEFCLVACIFFVIGDFFDCYTDGRITGRLSEIEYERNWLLKDPEPCWFVWNRPRFYKLIGMVVFIVGLMFFAAIVYCSSNY